MSRDAFSAAFNASSVAVSTIGVIPSLSMPALTPEKNVFTPWPIIARKRMIAIIHMRKPILVPNNGR